MKRTFVTLILTALIGAATSHAYEGIDHIEDYEDISDQTRDYLDRAQDYETDTMPGPTPHIDPIKLLPRQSDIYDMPYSLSGNYPNYHRLAANSALLVGGGLTTLVILDLLPENSTNWSKKEEKTVPMAQRYFHNVMNGPHVDGDNPVFNYILHPYAGAAYYMSARSLGFNAWYSALYSFAVSTIFWEYGVEAFMEIPSWQDLVITPVIGSMLGECFYLAKRHIVQHDYRLLGWKPLGYVAAFILDPVNEFLGYFRGNPAHSWYQRHHGGLADNGGTSLQIDSRITLTPDPHTRSLAPTLSLSLTF